MKTQASRAGLCLVAAALAAACTGPAKGEPLGIRVQFLGGEGGGLPTGVTNLTIVVAPYPSEAPECTPANPSPVTQTFEVANLTDLDGNGRQEAVLSDMPWGCWLYATVEAYSGVTLSYSGRADSIILETEGQRRFIDMTLTPVDSVSLLPAELAEPAFGLTATALAETDGRVLVAGGFTQAVLIDDCAPHSYPGALCFELTATNRAYIYDQGSADAYETRTRMNHARALHSATLLGDGRVLVAGGVSSAVLVLQEADSGAPSWAGYEILDIVALDAASSNTYEIFDPESNAEAVDVDHDGDAGRGGFLASTPGTMLYGRYAHAASALETPAYPTTHLRRVLLTGGFGTGSSTTIDVFSLDAPGGMGFLTGSALQATLAERLVPASVMLDDFVWVFGGTPQPGNGDLATPNVAVGERRDPSESGDEWPVGTINFSDITTPHAELVRLLPEASPLGTDGQTILVTGWYGARCGDVSGAATPTYDYSAATYICPPAQATDFAVDASVTSPVITAAAGTGTPHALASVVGLVKGDRTGAVLVAGGITDLDFATTDVIDLYSGETDTSGAPLLDTAFAETLTQARAFGAAAELGGGDVLFAGGAAFDLAAGEIAILGSIELLNW